MKCPHCNAKLMPVNRELFCLQCGEMVHHKPTPEDGDLKLEETLDPLLQRAIRDAGNPDAHFTVEAVRPKVPSAKPKRSFASLQTHLAPERLIGTSGAWSGWMTASAHHASANAVALLPALPATHRHEPAKAAHGRRMGVRTAIAAALGLVALGGLNFGAAQYYSERVYPGVRVGNVAVGNWTYAELHEKLPSIAAAPGLTAVVGQRRLDLRLAAAAKLDEPALERSVQQAGRGGLPLAGVAGSLVLPPIKPAYGLADSAVAAAAKRLAAQVDRTPASAVAFTMGANVFVLADKPGLHIDQAAAQRAIRSAYGQAATVSLSATKLEPAVVAADWAPDVAAAQAIISAAPELALPQAPATPTAEQIASWIVFKGPGKGVMVDPAGTAAYVAAQPGSFDRAGASASLTAALATGKAAKLAIAATPVTVAPKPASAMPAWPLAQYTYCAVNTGDAARELVATAGTQLGKGGPWTLGGRVQYVLGTQNCHVVATIGQESTLKALDAACGTQSSCRIHNDIAISAAAWAKAPATWTGDVASYRAELVNHVVGQWLGFDHASCSTAATAKPVLNAPHITIAGCSPQWYPVPAELQDTKVLSGF